MTKVSDMFADVTAMLEILHGMAIDGQNTDLDRAEQTALAASIDSIMRSAQGTVATILERSVA